MKEEEEEKNVVRAREQDEGSKFLIIYLYRVAQQVKCFSGYYDLSSSSFYVYCASSSVALFSAFLILIITKNLPKNTHNKQATLSLTPLTSRLFNRT